MARSKIGVWCVLLVLSGCAPKPALVASNCDDPKDCAKAEALKIDAVDILLVVDDSPSIAPVSIWLKEQLPELLNAITSGDTEQASFPAARSVHVAVTTTDMGIGMHEHFVAGCNETGQDGVFVKPGERELSCDVKLPSYLAFEGGPAAIATVDTVSCVPLVAPSDSANAGCGYEQPLEAALKALWPVADDSLHFLHGTGHGDAENAGFLRDDSLLVVIVVTDEDDCSAADDAAFDVDGPVNLACLRHANMLQSTARYVDALRALRPNNPNTIFALIGGIPVELLQDEFRAGYDFASDRDVVRYYDAVLADARLEIRVTNEDPPFGQVAPSCTRVTSTAGPGELRHDAFPPRRLIEVAKGFGARSVLGSLCGDDFGGNTGRLIRAISERLANPAAK